jgi:hypothetical protein
MATRAHPVDGDFATKVETSDKAEIPAKAAVVPGQKALHVVDLGKARSKQIRALKDGDGPLINDIATALADIEGSMTAEQLVGKALYPVVFIVERRRKKTGLMSMLGGI